LYTKNIRINVSILRESPFCALLGGTFRVSGARVQGNNLLALLGRDVELEVSSPAARRECHELLDEPQPLLLELVPEPHVARVGPLATAVVHRGGAGTAVRKGGGGIGSLEALQEGGA
jgi:hypothetical protein